MTHNTSKRLDRREQKITASLFVVIAACYASAIATLNHGYWYGAAGAFVVLLASMYLLSTTVETPAETPEGS